MLKRFFIDNSFYRKTVSDFKKSEKGARAFVKTVSTMFSEKNLFLPLRKNNRIGCHDDGVA